ncbi:hypothetical protein GJAV_G00020810 [Gymnothorax javanicus]|nr:hypothetical protein GJAV_G00020810 [Gymnothorax javanicus]
MLLVSYARYGRICRIISPIQFTPGREPVLKLRSRCLIIPAPDYQWAGFGGHRPPEKSLYLRPSEDRGWHSSSRPRPAAGARPVWSGCL